ncbi:hypothetical protein KIW84_052431 [Lathyrus oleraceus]|uniref:Uncharacterized protein n=1 Tax=Pisum sativum TaxID=3888 RepID=A0A9D5AHF0_PEA|nr:hypothetical protein KIW84_052431 [Pisum sativum]
MEGENSVYYKDFNLIGNVLLKASVTESMFTSWFLANRDYEEARLLTYGQFVSKFVYVKKQRCRKPGKRGFTHASFQEACFAMGFLQDDKEFIAAIKEVYDWGFGIFL